MRRSFLCPSITTVVFLACGVPPRPEGVAEDRRSIAASAVPVGRDAIVSGTGVGLNLRDGPSRTANVIEVMPDGTRVHVTGGAQDGFLPVDVEDGHSGWAWAGYLAVIGDLQAIVDGLAAEVGSRSPGTDLAIAVRDLTTGEYAAFQDGVTHVSASAAKAIWVAAALHSWPVATVSPYANAIFARSDNDAAGAVIDLIGPNAENDFYQFAKMTSSAFTEWDFGKTRVATNSPRAMGSDNYFTAADTVGFLAGLDDRSLITPYRSTTLESWMTRSPRSGFGGWLGTLLPAGAQTAIMHKAGWLPPGCCGDDSYYNTLNEIGIVQVPDGDRYAIAIFARRGSDYWGAQVSFVEHASCVVYRAIAGDASLDCG